MKLYVGITDYDWFRYLQAMQPEELNFWQPGGMKLFKTLLPGEPFLFKLHSPHPAGFGVRRCDDRQASGSDGLALVQEEVRRATLGFVRQVRAAAARTSVSSGRWSCPTRA